MNGLREKEREENGNHPHNFILRSLDKPQKYYLKVPSTRLSLHSSNTPNSYTSHLSFNHDLNPYTPAFIQRSGEEAYSFTSFTVQSQKTLDWRNAPLRPRIGEGKQRKTMILPEPTSKFCSVCRENFSNYFSHINHPVHLKKASDSEGNRLILDLVEVIKEKASKEQRLRVTNGRMNQKVEETSSTRFRNKSPEFQSSSPLLPSHK